MMWPSIAPPTPVRRFDRSVCMDLTSPWASERRFSAPIPMTWSPSHADQNWMSGDRNPPRSSACALPGAVSARALAK